MKNFFNILISITDTAGDAGHTDGLLVAGGESKTLYRQSYSAAMRDIVVGALESGGGGHGQHMKSVVDCSGDETVF